MDFTLFFSIAIPSGIVSGIISPFIVSWLKHTFIWKRQREIELKNSIFRDAARALSMLETDATDPALQSDKASYKGKSRSVEARSQTFEFCITTGSLIESLFSNDAFKAWDKAYRTPISIEKAPDLEFATNRSDALKRLANEL
jgi:hypothetical protein